MKIPSLDLQTGLLFFLTVGFLINSMALYHKEHYPGVVLYNPATNIARLVQADRTEASMRDLYLGGFRNAVAIALGAHPFEMPAPRLTKVKERILVQIFSPEAADYIQKTRERSAVYQIFGTSELSFNAQAEQDIKILPRNGGLFFEAFFNQTIPVGENEKRIRTFHVRAFGNVAPATQDNPYNIKFSQIEIREIQPKTPRN